MGFQTGKIYLHPDTHTHARAHTHTHTHTHARTHARTHTHTQHADEIDAVRALFLKLNTRDSLRLMCPRLLQARAHVCMSKYVCTARGDQRKLPKIINISLNL